MYTCLQRELSLMENARYDMTTLTAEAPPLLIMLPQVKTLQAPRPIEQATRTLPTVQAEDKQDLADDQLISAICEGAEWAMELIYQRHSRYAYALAYRILRDTSAAEDTVQDAFLAVWRKA